MLLPALFIAFSKETSITGAVISALPTDSLCYETTVCSNETVTTCINETIPKCESNCVNETKEICTDECQPQCSIEEINGNPRETCIMICTPVCTVETTQNCSLENCQEVTEEKCSSGAVEKCRVETVCPEKIDEIIVNKPINETVPNNQSPAVAENNNSIINESVLPPQTAAIGIQGIGIQTAPVISSLVLNTTNVSTNDTNVNLTAYNISNTAKKIIWNWLRNDTSFMLLNMPFGRN